MGFSLSGSKSKSREQTTGSETYNPNAGFVSGVNGLLGRAGGMQYGRTSQADIDRFANPYLEQVGEQTSRQIGRSRDIAGNNIDAQGAAAGAFGGSGWGLLRGENNRAFADAEATALAGINAGGYDRALGAAMGENQNANQFDLSALMAQLQGYGLLNYGTTNTTGLAKRTGSQIGASGSFTYGGGR